MKKGSCSVLEGSFFSGRTCNFIEPEECKLLHIETLCKFKCEGNCLVRSALEVNVSKLKSLLSSTGNSALKCLQYHLRVSICHKQNLRQQIQFSEDILTSIPAKVNRPSHNSQTTLIQVALQVSYVACKMF